MTEIDISEFTDARARRLQEFLAAPGRPAGTMSYFKLTGFLFAVCSSPEPIQPSEWLPLVFDDQEADYQSLEEAREILGAIMSLYNRVNGEVMERRAELPPGLVLREEPIDNLESDAHLSQWSRGFMYGHDWLEELWTDYTPEELDEELGALLFILFFFADRKLAEGFHREMWRQKNTLAEAAGKLLPLFTDSMKGYAHMGRSMHETIVEFERQEREQEGGQTPGRNDPCPCGSGRKYKRCCGAD